MLKLDNLCKTFNPGTVNEKKALNNMNLELKQGDFVTVIGSNGAGKSTMFSAIAGNYIADTGRIFLDGEDVTYKPEYKRSREIGRLFQDPLKGSAPNMTIEENLAMAYFRANSKGGIFARIGKIEREAFKTALEKLQLGLENRMSSPVGLLSGGQRQALTLLMATMVTPKLLLLDEHTAALDPETATKVLDLTRQIVKDNAITCMMITHNIASALEIGNRTIMMDDGNIVLDIQGEDRDKMTVSEILEAFKQNAKKALDNDRILLSI